MMRAKMSIRSIESFPNQDNIVLSCVCDKPFGPEGESEDNTFARYTPNGVASFSIMNPSLVGKFSVGQTFYVDFTLVE